MSQNEIDLTLEKIDGEMALLHRKRARVRAQWAFVSHAKPSQEVLTEILRLSACRLNLREPQLYSIASPTWFYLFSLEERNLVCSIPLDYVPSGTDPVPPLIVALMFSNAGDSCASVEVNLNKISHESLLLIFQHHWVQIRALRLHAPRMGSIGILFFPAHRMA